MYKAIESLVAPGLRLGLAALLLAPASAQAADRAFVSAAIGADSPTCGALATPCRTFQTAHDNIAVGGEISVLDPGDYSPVHITKSMSIINGGVGTAGVWQTPAGGDAVTIDAGATDKVALRGLSLRGGDIGQYGVRLNAAASLSIIKCVIRGFTGGTAAGISLAPTGAASFVISDTVLSNNFEGVRVWPTADGSATGVFERVAANNNHTGFEIMGPVGGSGTSRISIIDSSASNNIQWGVHVQGQSSASVFVSARGVVASHNGDVVSGGYDGSGFVANFGTLRLAHSVATGNTHGVTITGGGLVESFGDNDLRGNAVDPVNIVSTGNFTTVYNQ